jgi:hypothetical protein
LRCFTIWFVFISGWKCIIGKLKMLETLYKVKAPEEVPVQEAEYYELVLDAEWINNRVAYLVREHHGWWDDANKRNVNSWVTFSPEHGYATYDEALQRINCRGKREPRADSSTRSRQTLKATGNTSTNASKSDLG